jgi:phospholipase C
MASSRVAFLLFCLWAFAGDVSVLSKVFPQNKIDTVVVLMMENRSFDHMLGWLKKQNKKVDGLTGQEWNPKNCSDPNSPRIAIREHADYAPGDLGHEVVDTTEQMTCAHLTDHSRQFKHSEFKMNGFVTNAHHVSYAEKDPKLAVKDVTQAMEAFPEKEVPVIYQLAKMGTFSDNYYCSVPGPTQNNRLFFHCGSVSGLCVNMDIKKVALGLTEETLFEKLLRQDVDCGIYQHDLSSVIYFRGHRKPSVFGKFHFFNKFLEQAKAGKLPAFSFIEPRYFDLLAWKANDQHPSHPVPYGEKLIKDVYEAVRNGPKWKSTALIITYDEHGGFFDHVVPPMSAPDPEAKRGPCKADGGGPKGFRYNRLGLRVPFIVVSPWTPKALIHHTVVAKKSPGKEANGFLEHTSVWNTMKKLFGVTGDLSTRSAWAGDFYYWFDFKLNGGKGRPDTDFPTTLVSPAVVKDNDNDKTNGLQRDFTRVMSAIIGVPAPEGMMETKAGQWIQKCVEKSQSLMDSAKELVNSVKDKVSETKDKVVDKVKDLSGKAQEKVKNWWDKLTGKNKFMLIEQWAEAQRKASTIPSWSELQTRREALTAHSRTRKGPRSAVLEPAADHDLPRFATAEAEAEARVLANIPHLTAAGTLMGPDARDPLFDMDSYLQSGPYFMPGILSQVAEEEGMALDDVYDMQLHEEINL